MRPSLLRDARRKLALDDACLVILAAAKWSLDFLIDPSSTRSEPRRPGALLQLPRALLIRYVRSRRGGASSGVQASRRDGKKRSSSCTRGTRWTRPSHT